MGTSALSKSLAEAAGLIADGASIAMGKRFPMALVRELVRQKRWELRLIGMPITGLPADLLASAGALTSVEAGAITLGPDGLPASFLRAEAAGQVSRKRSSCSLIVAGLIGGAAGAPFVAVPGLLGSDLLADRPDLKISADPFEPGRDVVLSPVIRPDFALIHAKRADPAGNLVVGSDGDEALLARASGAVIATVEEICTEAITSLSQDEELIPALYVAALVTDPWGTYPYPSWSMTKRDSAALQAQIAASAEPGSAAAFLDRHLAPGSDESSYRKAFAS